MKRYVLITSLALMFIALGAGMAFADTPGNGQAHGELLYQQNAPENRLDAKLERLEALVDLDRLTPEQAEAFEDLITERMTACDESGREGKDRLAVGFGRSIARGAMEGTGNRFGR